MSTLNTGEKSHSITVIAASLIMALAVGGGLVKVGAGFASRTDNGITVTGSAKTTATPTTNLSRRIASFGEKRRNRASYSSTSSGDCLR